MKKKDLPNKLGGEFWFCLSVIPFSLAFAWLAVLQKSGRNFIGSVLVTAIFAWRAYDRVRQVRLARFLNENPQARRLYDAWDGE